MYNQCPHLSAAPHRQHLPATFYHYCPAPPNSLTLRLRGALLQTQEPPDTSTRQPCPYTYQSSTSDVVVYTVTPSHLLRTKIKPPGEEAASTWRQRGMATGGKRAPDMPSSLASPGIYRPSCRLSTKGDDMATELVVIRGGGTVHKTAVAAVLTMAFGPARRRTEWLQDCRYSGRGATKVARRHPPKMVAGGN